MKHTKLIIISFIGVAAIVSGCLIANKIIANAKVKDIEDKTKIEPTGLVHLDVKGTTDLIIGDLKTGDYAPGTKFTFKIQSVTDVTFYPYLNNQRLRHISVDENDNAQYEFEMPGNGSELAISGDPFYLDKNYTISEIFAYYNLTAENVTKVILKSGAIGTYNNTPTILESTDPSDISYNLNVFNNEPFRKLEQTVERNGGSYVSLSFVTNEYTTDSITISNGEVCYQDFSTSQYFTYANESPNRPKIDHPLTNATN